MLERFWNLFGKKQTHDKIASGLETVDPYASHDDAVIISCFFNPMVNPYRLLAFHRWHQSIQHLNYRVIECIIGDGKPQLPNFPNISRVFAENLLWHKETLLNKIVADLPRKFKYVFWLDADVLFANQNWLVESVAALQWANIVQPFEHCVHLERNQTQPQFDMDAAIRDSFNLQKRHPMVWRSFCANHTTNRTVANDTNYDIHGHVGFAWGARREVLDACPLYDKALIGGADHVMAHAAAGHIPHSCIRKGYADDIDAVEEWSRRFFGVVNAKIGFTSGNLLHLWHGDIRARQYLKRIQDFTKVAKGITKRNNDGLYVGPNDDYMQRYFREREVMSLDAFGDYYDKAFLFHMGYDIWDATRLFGGPSLDDGNSATQKESPTIHPVDDNEGGGFS